MSSLDEKLEHVRTTSGNARATLAQLAKRWGSPDELDVTVTAAPEMLLVRQMDGTREYWKLVERGKSPGTAWFELVEVLPADGQPRPLAGQPLNERSPDGGSQP